jgi:hypothetical protein
MIWNSRRSRKAVEEAVVEEEEAEVVVVEEEVQAEPLPQRHRQRKWGTPRVSLPRASI